MYMKQNALQGVVGGHEEELSEAGVPREILKEVACGEP